MEILIGILILGLAAGVSSKNDKPKNIKQIKVCEIRTYKRDCAWKRVK